MSPGPMTVVPGLLLLLALTLVEPVPHWLARARWAARAPRPALVLWQAIGLSAGFAGIAAGVGYGVAPLAGSIPDGVRLLAQQARQGRPIDGLGPTQVVAILASLALAARLTGMLAGAAGRMARDRHRHRVLVDLLSAPYADLGGARVLEHPGTVAYCLPGLRSRVVLSAGAVRALDPAELTAVLAHEHAHVAERHDLVVLPFVAWRAALPFLSGVRCAQPAVSALIEMVADDRARAAVGAGVLASAIARVGTATAPRGALAVSGSPVLDRVARLLDPRPVPRWVPAAAYLGAATLVGFPVLLLLVPGGH